MTWVHGDVLDHPFRPGSFDVVASIATLHHLPDPRRALARFAELTAPGGVVVVVGLARSSGVGDLSYDLCGTVLHRVLAARRGYREHSAPTVWPPPHTYRQVRALAGDSLPGCRWRRLALWRYLLTWTAPA